MVLKIAACFLLDPNTETYAYRESIPPTISWHVAFFFPKGSDKGKKVKEVGDSGSQRLVINKNVSSVQRTY